MSLEQIISDLIATKTGGDYWDFKVQYPDEKKPKDLLLDIVCLANNVHCKGYDAIMMIDFALEIERGHVKPEDASVHDQKHLTSHDVIYQACLIRFRPIMMTTIAAMLGTLPLAIGTGEGAELRQPLGISIIGGLMFSQMLTLYTTPVVYMYLDRLRLRR